MRPKKRDQGGLTSAREKTNFSSGLNEALSFNVWIRNMS